MWGAKEEEKIRADRGTWREDEKCTLGNVLFKGEKVVEIGDMLYKMWKEIMYRINMEEMVERNGLR